MELRDVVEDAYYQIYRDTTRWIVLGNTGLDIKTDISETFTSVADDDIFAVTDESTGGDPTRQILASDVQTYMQDGACSFRRLLQPVVLLTPDKLGMPQDLLDGPIKHSSS